MAHGQAAAEAKVPLAEEVFKNIQVLKGIPVDEFMSTMGIFSAALGMSCENCHAADDRDWANYAGDNTPKKRTARGMVMMMAAINKNYFAGRQVVTCYSCHRGGDHPKTTPNLDTIYGHPPEEEEDDIVVQDPKAPTVEQILDKYIQARGGAQRLGGFDELYRQREPAPGMGRRANNARSKFTPRLRGSARPSSIRAAETTSSPSTAAWPGTRSRCGP